MASQFPDLVVVGDVEVATATEKLGYRVMLVAAEHLVLADLPLEVACEAALLWVPARCCSEQPASSTLRVILNARDRMPHTVIDVAYSSELWLSAASAALTTAPLVSQSTVALGSTDDFAVAIGSGDARDAAGKILLDGVQLGVIRDDFEVLLADAEGLEMSLPRGPAMVGSKARSDGAFGAAIAHGLLSGWTPSEMIEFANTGEEPVQL